MTTTTNHQTTTGGKGAPLGPPRVDTGIVDCDIHPAAPDGALDDYLDPKWVDYVRKYGVRTTHGLVYATEYPPFGGGAMRADAWPEEGIPGSSLELMQQQLLDPYNVQLGILQLLNPLGGGLVPSTQMLNQELADAVSTAANDWQIDFFVRRDPRLRLSMLATFESPDLAVTEIERIGSDPAVVSILGMSKTQEPLGSRKYWPIYEAAEKLGLPIQIHLSQGGTHPNTGTGWTSYHVEYHTAHTQSFQHQLLSMILQGVFDRFPDLRVVLVEGNVAHFAPLVQRLDYHWETLRAEVPNLQRRPSEYIRDHVFLSTQPLDEPDDPQHLYDMIEEFGADNVLFASDYPHFDFDDPDNAFPAGMSENLRSKILTQNAVALFDL
jgi:predicted TIM-barrel fold metal-dependent hydrolase